MTSVEPMQAFCSRFYLAALEKGCEMKSRMESLSLEAIGGDSYANL